MSAVSIIDLAGVRATAATPATRAQKADPTAGALRVGAQLRARVVAIPGDGRPAQLAVAGRILDAATELSLKAGDELRLQVVRAGARPILRVLSLSPAQPGTELRIQALRVALARQSALLPAIEALRTTTLDRPAGGTPGSVPPITAESIMAVLARAATVTEPAALREAIRTSGVFLEARLAALTTPVEAPGGRATDALTHDLKAALLRALPSIAAAREETDVSVRRTASGNAHDAPRSVNPGQPPPSPVRNETLATARHAVEGALARITAHQLQALTDPSGASGQILNVELPILREGRLEPLALSIRRDDPGGNRESQTQPLSRWEIELSTTIAPIGSIHARIGFFQRRITVNLWAEHPATHALFERELDRLTASLDGGGLTVHAVRCHRGTPPRRPDREVPELFGAHA